MHNTSSHYISCFCDSIKWSARYIEIKFLHLLHNYCLFFQASARIKHLLVRWVMLSGTVMRLILTIITWSPDTVQAEPEKWLTKLNPSFLPITNQKTKKEDMTMLPMKNPNRTTPRKRTKKNPFLKNLCFLLDKVHPKLRQVIYFYFYILTNFYHNLKLLCK